MASQTETAKNGTIPQFSAAQDDVKFVPAKNDAVPTAPIAAIPIQEYPGWATSSDENEDGGKMQFIAYPYGL